ncbi:ABC transporter ATP-binding protein [Arsenicitalea aurantiaca]|uniref:Nickel import system ATP-binding protein NikD n=1 Tax=Arsenicitalea aurantiaca TaxID=1783274 RepID=A0A433XM78_9HYPH|nr:ATP-binding cassette domain-containing protein [Arsenicitalea aurantiaca]RUT35153.1 ABC transporter ATP-binding protein [Arsenicitalea aurantiaca]
MLEITDLSIAFRRYGPLLTRRETRMLGPLELTLSRGEVLAVVGASGAGKSLLAHAIFGVLPGNAVVSGALRLDGTPLDAARQAALCGRLMALVPQSITHLDPLVRAGRQVGWAAGRSGHARRARHGLARDALARFGLGPDAARAYPHALSGGMARRVMLAMASVGSADLIVADEPTNGLDPENAGRVLDHLRSLADRGRAVMMITHDLTGALGHADRVAILREGQLVEIAPATAFRGAGEGLASPYARALWQALPANGFLVPVAAS